MIPIGVYNVLNIYRKNKMKLFIAIAITLMSFSVVNAQDCEAGKCRTFQPIRQIVKPLFVERDCEPVFDGRLRRHVKCKISNTFACLKSRMQNRRKLFCK